MAKNNRFVLDGSSYIQNMEFRTNQFNNLITQAERIRHQNNGKPTREEADFYYKAAEVCDQVINMNLSQNDVRVKWIQLRQSCVDEVRRISEALNPRPAAVPPQPKREPIAPVTPAAPATPVAAGQENAQFQTKFASKDVPAETIASWFKNPPAHGIDDVTGMEALKNQLLDEVANLGWDRVDAFLHIQPAQSYFFYGPPGSGKTYLIEAFANHLMEKGFKFMRLLGGDIHASLVGVAEKTVQTAFQEAMDKEPCLIFIDEVEGVCVNRENGKAEGHEKRLTVAFLEAYNLLRESNKRVIFMGATNHPGQVDAAMLDRVKMIRIPLPDKAAREAYFIRKFENLPLDGLTFQDMAEVTDNYSYRDLGRLADAIAFQCKTNAIGENRVLDNMGTLNQDETDKAASAALEEGRIALTAEMFRECCRNAPPSDKSKIEAELRAFEERPVE